MSFGMTVVLIVLIVTIGHVLKSWAERAPKRVKLKSDPDAAMLKEEVRHLRDRIAVLERIATDKNHALELEFERLRDR